MERSVAGVSSTRAPQMRVGALDMGGWSRVQWPLSRVAAANSVCPLAEVGD